MPGWLLDAALPAIVFGVLFVVWVGLPAPEGEEDAGSKIRGFFKQVTGDRDGSQRP